MWLKMILQLLRAGQPGRRDERLLAGRAAWRRGATRANAGTLKNDSAQITCSLARPEPLGDREREHQGRERDEDVETRDSTASTQPPK